MAYIGEYSALFTSFCWAVAAIGFSFSTNRIGSGITNRVRALIALLALMVINLVLYGQLIPLQANGTRWFWLVLSGIVGLAIGDGFLFMAFRDVGPRISLLLLSVAPVFGSLIAWPLFGETLTLQQIGGMTVTLAGIAWVVLARPAEGEERSQHHIRGIIFGLLGALGQAGGLILSRQGMSDNFSPFSGTLIRMVAAVAILWGLALVQGQVDETVKVIRNDRYSLRWITFGAFFASVLGISASLLAVQHAEIGVASTLMALPPVFMLPMSYFFLKERLNWQSVAGTLVAILGIALLFLQ